MIRSEKMAGVEKYLLVKDVANILSISEGHVYMLVKTGNLIAIDISCSGSGGSKSMRISVSSILSFQKSREIRSQEKYDS